MKHRFAILLLSDSGYQPQFLGRKDWDAIDFFPGSRLKNYLEVLTGFGIPFEVRDIRDLRHEDIIGEDQVNFSTILFTSPIAEIRSSHLEFFKECSRSHGISLILDAFLLANEEFGSAFGIKKCSGLRIGLQHIKDHRGSTIYKTKLLPHSSIGVDIGIRPVIRLLMQSWFSRRISTDGDVSDYLAQTESANAPVLSYTFGNAVNFCFNFHPSLVLASANRFHTLLREMFESNPHFSAASLSLENLGCLRIDDPGSSERVHLEGFNDGVLSARTWKEMIDLLERHSAKLNVAYVPGWIDDGDETRGTLAVEGEPIKSRTPGKRYDSWKVTYSKSGRPNSHDHASEYRAIKEGVELGTLTILSHGLTHMTTDLGAWLSASNRYTEREWFREFKERVTRKQPPPERISEKIRESLAAINEAFGVETKILVPSAHEHTEETPGIAKNSGIRLFSSRATYLIGNRETVKNRKIKAFYPEDMPEGMAYSKAGYPIVFVFHDFDTYKHGAGWLESQIESLKGHGIKSFPSMDTFAALLMAKIEVVSEDKNTIRVTVEFDDLIDTDRFSGDIPLRIHGQISDTMVNGKPFAGEPTVVDGVSLISIPFSYIKNSMLTITAQVSGK